MTNRKRVRQNAGDVRCFFCFDLLFFSSSFRYFLSSVRNVHALFTSLKQIGCRRCFIVWIHSVWVPTETIQMHAWIGKNWKNQHFELKKWNRAPQRTANNNNQRKTKWLNHTTCQPNMLCKWHFDRNRMLLNVMKLIRIAFFFLLPRTQIRLLIFFSLLST